MANKVEVKDVFKTYKRGKAEFHALNGISLSIKEGEFLAVMGPSGSGKSTLLHLIGALDKPTSGEVFIDGVSLSLLGDDALSQIRREKVGFIFQQFNLLPTLTARENILLPLRIAGKSSRETERYADEVIEAVGLTNWSGNLPEEMSGGQMQRVGIARALAIRPSIILADEPTGNLDSKTSEEILNLLKDCQEQFKQTIIMVTHDAKAAAYGDRIIRLKDGQIDEEVEAYSANLI